MVFRLYRKTLQSVSHAMQATYESNMRWYNPSAPSFQRRDQKLLVTIHPVPLDLLIVSVVYFRALI